MNTIIVASNLTLADRIAAGRYEGYINSSITENNFPHDPSTVGEWEWKLFHFGQHISSEAAESAIIADGWMPGKLEHQLTFGEKYPDEQRKHPVVALGSSCVFDRRRCVPRLYSGPSERDLRLFGWGYAWYVNNRFLAVRRVA